MYREGGQAGMLFLVLNEQGLVQNIGLADAQVSYNPGDSSPPPGDCESLCHCEAA